MVELPEGTTDASLTSYHIDRGKLFVGERLAKNRHIAGTRWSTNRYLNMELLRQRNAMIA